MSKINVSIVVPTFNSEVYIDELIKAVYSQATKYKYELIIIDSGSIDNTLEIVKNYSQIRLYEIPNKEFGHGKTRNYGANLSNGEYIIFLTDDAIPSHNQWLQSMIEPFTLFENVGCVFGKQIPRPDCFVTLKREVYSVFKSFGDDGSISIQRLNKLTESRNITNNFMSDVNSAIKKSVWEKIKFKDVNYAEDQLMGIDILNAGYLKAYTPLGSVYHSHNLKLKDYFKRKFDEYVGLRQSTGHIVRVNITGIVFGSFKSTILDYIFLFRDKDYTLMQKIHDAVLSPLYNLALRLAIRQAANSNSEESIRKYSLEHQTRKKST